MFMPAIWLRSLIKPGKREVLAYIDFYRQEFLMAAALSDDPEIKTAYSTGDPYLAFAKQAGAVSLSELEDRCLYFAFEESPSQIIRNMKSIGIDFQPCVDTGLMQISASRPMAYGLEMHLVAMHRLIDKSKPAVVILNPISNMINVGGETNVKFTLIRLVDYLTLKNITTLCTGLIEHESIEGINVQVYLLSWILGPISVSLRMTASAIVGSRGSNPEAWSTPTRSGNIW